ncbi:MAG: GNAT family N-acetyltransferase [Patescibacteria group bacterium]
MSEISSITVESISDSSVETVDQLNNVLVQLSAESAVSAPRLQKIIESETADIIIAKDGEKIVGMATVNIIQKLASSKAELEDFVVDSDQRGKGIADKLWLAMVEWCKAKDVKEIEFTSRASRTAAQKFYAKMGAEIRETNVFRYKIN